MKTITYWTTTLIIACGMTFTGVLSVTHSQVMMEDLAHLGYPPYFADLLGVAKLLGVCVLLAPGWIRVKEWAYTGFGITILSASYSHLLTGNKLMAVEPLFAFALLTISYLTRPPGRRQNQFCTAVPVNADDKLVTQGKI